jgi:hypothetical protein
MTMGDIDGTVAPPGRPVRGVGSIEVIDAAHERINVRAHVGAQLIQVALGHTVVIESLCEDIALDAVFAGKAGALADAGGKVLQQFLRPVFGLGPAHGIHAGGLGGGVDVWHAPGVAVHHGLAGVVSLAGQRRGVGGSEKK